MQERLERVSALMFLEYYSLVKSPLALIIEKQTHVCKSPPISTNPGFATGRFFGVCIASSAPVGGEL